jgi:stringent starvation protein B
MSDGTRQLPPKKEVALALLEGSSMFVHLDPRRAGVNVPKRFLDKPQLVLQIGLNMFIPIPDLKVDDEGITCTLSFDRAPFWVCMPWSAIYALVGEDGRGMMWPNDIPPEVVAQMQNPPAQAGQKPVPAKKQRKLAAVADAPPSEGPAVSGPVSTNPQARDERLAAESEPEPEAASAEAPESDGEDADKTTGPASPAARPQQGARKPKRELPPYLRVVK